MRNKSQKAIAAVTAFALLFGTVAVPPQDARAAVKKASIAKKAKVAVGKTVKIALKNNKKTVKWSVAKGKELVKLTKKTKSSATVKGIKRERQRYRRSLAGRSIPVP